MYKYISGSFNEVQQTLNELSSDSTKKDFTIHGFVVTNSTVYQLVSYDEAVTSIAASVDAVEAPKEVKKPTRSRRKPTTKAKKTTDKPE